MKPRPDGSTVKISPYDTRGDMKRPETGDYVVTVAGTVYEVVSSYRVSPRSRLPSGVHARYSLTCKKLGRVPLPEDATTYLLEWYPRKKRRP
jgi:hypothetical protein